MRGIVTKLGYRAAALAALLMTAGAFASAASAQTFERIHFFCHSDGCPDGQFPTGALVRDQSGNLFGTTVFGGLYGFGTVFEMSPGEKAWKYKVLYSFCPEANCADGKFPAGGVIVDAAGNLYGTASGGGGALNAGVLFELVNTGGTLTMRTLHDFCSEGGGNCTDGFAPGSLTYAGASAGLPYDGASPLYGTTSQGGLGSGTAFAYEQRQHGRKHVLHTLHRFCARSGCADGSTPNGLTLDGSGNLFGTTHSRGGGGGTLFEIGADGRFSLLHTFCSAANCADGVEPHSGVHIDAAGNLFGTTYIGGAQNSGVVYELRTDRGAAQYSVLHDFCSFADCADGSHPQAGVIADAGGNLYGVTTEGGGINGTGFQGALYELNDTYTVLHTFAQKTHGQDGNNPSGGLLLDPQGTFYGTTQNGGRFLGGTVFALTP